MSAPTRPQRSGRWLPFALDSRGGIPLITGTLRRSELAGTVTVLPPNPGFAASRAAAVIRVASAIPDVRVQRSTAMQAA
jgi:hypothetical protein